MGSIRLLFTGDLCPHLRVEGAVLGGRSDTVLGDLLPLFQEEVVSITNLECPLCEPGDRLDKLGPCIRADPGTVELLQTARFDIATLANNHIMDYGPRGLKRTLEVCRSAGILTVGAGNNLAEAGRPLYVERDGSEFALVNMTEHEFSIAGSSSPGANPLDLVSAHESIVAARRRTANVVAVVHGGHEGYSLPSPRMVRVYRHLVDLGAALVVGHHSHCYSGNEVYRGVPVFYGLGNFIFDWQTRMTAGWYEGCLLQAVLEDGRVTSFTTEPYRQCDTRVGLAALDVCQQSDFEREQERLCATIADADALQREWTSFCDRRASSYMVNLLDMGDLRARLFRRGVSLRLLTGRSNWKRVLNLVRCEAHRDVLTETLSRLALRDRRAK